MKKLALSATAALALLSAPAFAADMPVKAAKVAPVAAPSPFDIAFGAAVMNDYVFRGITQSNHKPSGALYVEPRYNITKDLQLYVGVSAESIDFPNDASAEIDFYGGARLTAGPFVFDAGLWYYYYPGGTEFNGLGPSPATCTNGFFTPTGFCNSMKGDVSFYEIYGKVTYTAGDFAFGINEYYTPSYLNSGAWGDYASVTAKYTAPAKMALGPLGWYVSGEFGRQWLGTTDAFYGTPAFPGGIDYKDYNTWNIGLGLTWKVFTLDLRYSDTDLSKSDCNAFTGDHTASFDPAAISPINPSGLSSKWCGATFIAKLSAELTFANLK